jgi:MerR family transcriptional regulator, copper efflux regulator
MGRDGLLIGEIAQRSGVTRKALRLYEEAKILPAARRTASGYRLYGADALAVLSFVRKAQGLGFTLAEIKDIVAIRRSGRAPCPQVCDLVRRKAADLDRRLADLAEVRRGLRRLLNDWRSWDGVPAAVCAHIERDNRRSKSDGNREGAVVPGRLQPVPRGRVRRRRRADR